VSVQHCGKGERIIQRLHECAIVAFGPHTTSLIRHKEVHGMTEALDGFCRSLLNSSIVGFMLASPLIGL
jgi:hypothetical protein